MKVGGGEGEPAPPRSFICAIFRTVFDPRSSLFAPKPNGNACYAGLTAMCLLDFCSRINELLLFFGQ